MCTVFLSISVFHQCLSVVACDLHSLSLCMWGMWKRCGEHIRMRNGWSEVLMEVQRGTLTFLLAWSLTSDEWLHTGQMGLSRDTGQHSTSPPPPHLIYLFCRTYRAEECLVCVECHFLPVTHQRMSSQSLIAQSLCFNHPEDSHSSHSFVYFMTKQWSYY